MKGRSGYTQFAYLPTSHLSIFILSSVSGYALASFLTTLYDLGLGLDCDWTPRRGFYDFYGWVDCLVAFTWLGRIICWI